MNLHYLIGDATEPIRRPAILPHCCNNEGGWGRGYVLALSKKWPEPEKAYRNWYATKTPPFELGKVQLVRVTPDIQVANIIGQEGTRWAGKVPPIRYQAIEAGLRDVYRAAVEMNSFAPCTVHLPRIGAVLAGGEWPIIEKIIKAVMTVDTYVYTLESQKDRWPTEYITL